MDKNTIRIKEYYNLLGKFNSKDIPLDEQELIFELKESNDEDNITIAIEILKSKNGNYNRDKC